MSDLFDIVIYQQDNLDKYPMLKLAKDIVNSYAVKFIEPKYHWYLAQDGKQALSGYQVSFIDSDLGLSVIFGFGAYSSNRVAKDNNFIPSNQFIFLELSNTAEIAIFNDQGLVYIDEWQDTILGYQSPNEIMQVIRHYIIKS